MSWGVQAIGKAAAVRKEIARQFTTGGKCSEPEEAVRLAAAAAIDYALEAQDASNSVKVSASGSQGYRDYEKKTGVYNTLSISIEPQHGFVE
jgi:hypothetical protein